jgi:hypothetical protein
MTQHHSHAKTQSRIQSRYRVYSVRQSSLALLAPTRKCPRGAHTPSDHARPWPRCPPPAQCPRADNRGSRRRVGDGPHLPAETRSERPQPLVGEDRRPGERPRDDDRGPCRARRAGGKHHWRRQPNSGRSAPRVALTSAASRQIGGDELGRRVALHTIHSRCPQPPSSSHSAAGLRMDRLLDLVAFESQRPGVGGALAVVLSRIRYQAEVLQAPQEL